MAVIDFASHTLSYLTTTKGQEDPETGDFIKGQEYWVNNAYKCDIVPAGKANQITIPDGSVHPYSYTVYNLPQNCRDFVFGDKIRIHFFGKGCGQIFTVKGFHRYQHQCKIWI